MSWSDKQKTVILNSVFANIRVTFEVIRLSYEKKSPYPGFISFSWLAGTWAADVQINF